jgi:5-methylcytosine-specific restriction endonuclease McrA
MPRPEYAGPEWQAVRRLVLARDGYVCQVRRPKCTFKATQVDHVVSVTNGGPRLDPSNLVATCRSCNISKRNSEVAARARSESGNGAAVPQWCGAHGRPLMQCEHCEPWSERWY